MIDPLKTAKKKESQNYTISYNLHNLSVITQTWSQFSSFEQHITHSPIHLSQIGSWISQLGFKKKSPGTSKKSVSPENSRSSLSFRRVSSLDSNSSRHSTGRVSSLDSNSSRHSTGRVSSLDSNSSRHSTGRVSSLDSNSSRHSTGRVSSLDSNSSRHSTGRVSSLDSNSSRHSTGRVSSLDSNSSRNSTGRVSSLDSNSFRHSTGQDSSTSVSKSSSKPITEGESLDTVSDLLSNFESQDSIASIQKRKSDRRSSKSSGISSSPRSRRRSSRSEKSEPTHSNSYPLQQNVSKESPDTTTELSVTLRLDDKEPSAISELFEASSGGTLSTLLSSEILTDKVKSNSSFNSFSSKSSDSMQISQDVSKENPQPSQISLPAGFNSIERPINASDDVDQRSSISKDPSRSPVRTSRRMMSINSYRSNSTDSSFVLHSVSKETPSASEQSLLISQADEQQSSVFSKIFEASSGDTLSTLLSSEILTNKVKSNSSSNSFSSKSSDSTQIPQDVSHPSQRSLPGFNSIERPISASDGLDQRSSISKDPSPVRNSRRMMSINSYRSQEIPEASEQPLLISEADEKQPSAISEIFEASSGGKLSTLLGSEISTDKVKSNSSFNSFSSKSSDSTQISQDVSKENPQPSQISLPAGFKSIERPMNASDDVDQRSTISKDLSRSPVRTSRRMMSINSYRSQEIPEASDQSLLISQADEQQSSMISEIFEASSGGTLSTLLSSEILTDKVKSNSSFNSLSSKSDSSGGHKSTSKMVKDAALKLDPKPEPSEGIRSDPRQSTQKLESHLQEKSSSGSVRRKRSETIVQSYNRPQSSEDTFLNSHNSKSVPKVVSEESPNNGISLLSASTPKTEERTEEACMISELFGTSSGSTLPTFSSGSEFSEDG